MRRIQINNHQFVFITSRQFVIPFIFAFRWKTWFWWYETNPSFCIQCQLVCCAVGTGVAIWFGDVYTSIKWQMIDHHVDSLIDKHLSCDRKNQLGLFVFHVECQYNWSQFHVMRWLYFTHVRHVCWTITCFEKIGAYAFFPHYLWTVTNHTFRKRKKNQIFVLSFIKYVLIVFILCFIWHNYSSHPAMAYKWLYAIRNEGDS